MGSAQAFARCLRQRDGAKKKKKSRRTLRLGWICRSIPGRPLRGSREINDGRPRCAVCASAASSQPAGGGAGVGGARSNGPTRSAAAALPARRARSPQRGHHGGGELGVPRRLWSQEKSGRNGRGGPCSRERLSHAPQVTHRWSNQAERWKDRQGAAAFRRFDAPRDRHPYLQPPSGTLCCIRSVAHSLTADTSYKYTNC